MIKTDCIYYSGNSSAKLRTELMFADNQFSFRVMTDSGTVNHIRHLNQMETEYYPKMLIIRSLEYANEYLQINDIDFIKNFQNELNSKGKLHWYQRIINLSGKAYLGITIAMIGLVVGIYIYGLPWIANSVVYMLPQNFDKQIGETYKEKFLNYYYIDSAKTKIVNQFWNRTEQNEYPPINILIIESKTENAFALPDGTVVVFSGLLDDMNSPDELAGILAHEAAHVKGRHSLKKICRDLSGFIVISFIFNDVNGIMAIIGNNIDNLKSLSFSRDFEREADASAVEYLQNNNFSAKRLANLLNRISKSSSINIPAILSTHPDIKDRIKFINEYVAENRTLNLHNNQLDTLFEQLKFNN